MKLPLPDVLELCQAAGFDFVVVDLEHSTLTEAEAIALVRHADLLGLPALVRIPTVDVALINRLLENGAVGVQLSTLQTVAQNLALRSATRFAPAGTRSVSLVNRVAGYGTKDLTDFLDAERDSPPLLVGQIESPMAEPLAEVIAGLDVAFVGSTDLAVSLGFRLGDAALVRTVEGIRRATAEAGAAFGGWAPSPAVAHDAGLSTASYLVTGSDLQILGAGLRETAASRSLVAPAPPIPWSSAAQPITTPGAGTNPEVTP